MRMRRRKLNPAAKSQFTTSAETAVVVGLSALRARFPADRPNLIISLVRWFVRSSGFTAGRKGLNEVARCSLTRLHKLTASSACTLTHRVVSITSRAVATSHSVALLLVLRLFLPHVCSPWLERGRRNCKKSRRKMTCELKISERRVAALEAAVDVAILPV